MYTLPSPFPSTSGPMADREVKRTAHVRGLSEERSFKTDAHGLFLFFSPVMPHIMANTRCAHWHSYPHRAARATTGAYAAQCSPTPSPPYDPYSIGPCGGDCASAAQLCPVCLPSPPVLTYAGVTAQTICPVCPPSKWARKKASATPAHDTYARSTSLPYPKPDHTGRDSRHPDCRTT